MGRIKLDFKFNERLKRCEISGSEPFSELFALYIDDIQDESLILDFLEQPEKYSFGLGCNHDIFIHQKSGALIIEGYIYNSSTETFDFYSFPFKREDLEVVLSELKKFNSDNE